MQEHSQSAWPSWLHQLEHLLFLGGDEFGVLDNLLELAQAQARVRLDGDHVFLIKTQIAASEVNLLLHQRSKGNQHNGN